MTRRGARDAARDANGRATAPIEQPRGSLSRAAARRVDSEALDRYGIPSIVLMENAARAVADAAVRLAGDVGTQRIDIWCGPGNNGGDGYAAARHLHNRGFQVTLIAVGTPSPESDAGVNRAICLGMGLTVGSPNGVSPDGVAADAERAVIVDALLGTGLTRPPEGALRDAIVRIVALHEAGRPVVAVDLPSGVDADSGEPLGAAVRADVTVTFAAPKIGLLDPRAAEYVGRVIVGDIGVPRELVAGLVTMPRPRRGGDARTDR